jgi:hypothetical protein
MEAYLKQPCLPRSFFFPLKKPWSIHVHDRAVGKTIKSEGPIGNLDTVIYLYRSPIDVIFSQLKYDSKIPVGWTPKERSPELEADVKKLMGEYSTHLKRWRFENTDISNILEITYENLKDDVIGTVTKVLEFINQDVNTERLREICKEIDPQAIKLLTSHDQSVINDQSLETPRTYDQERCHFKNTFGEEINTCFKGLCEE